MLLKISLGLAILVGVVTLYLTHFQVGTKITGLNASLADTQAQLSQSQESEAAARAAEKTAKENLEVAVKDLNNATNALAAAVSKATEQQERANRATTELQNTIAERNDTQRELAAWKALGARIEDIQKQRDELRRITEERDVFAADNQLLNRRRKLLEAELAKYTGGNTEPTLPAGTKGKILAVDPKYDFVVLDIGGNQGLVENARMLVNRDGRLVAKVKITSVEPNRAIANIIPEWKQDEVMEGDQVIY
ncbi:MAG: hypothetical protein SFY81_11485 [Verrucomicrobiota bacterium]|nr:hypothetical protein [Verrucomicrobiota bacterium]